MDMWVPLEKKKTSKHKSQDGCSEQTAEEIIFFLVFIIFASFSDSRVSDRRISSGKTQKVLYATRATRGYQKHRISPRIKVNIRKILNF